MNCSVGRKLSKNSDAIYSLMRIELESKQSNALLEVNSPLELVLNYWISFSERSFLVFPAIIVFCFGGVPLRIADMQIANLFPKNKSFVISLYSGAFSASAITFVLLKTIWEFGVPFQWTCGILVAVSLAMLPVTFFLLPSDSIKDADLSESAMQLTFSDGKFFKRKNLRSTSTVTLESFKYLSSPKMRHKVFYIEGSENNNSKDVFASAKSLSRQTLSPFGSVDILKSGEQTIKSSSGNLSTTTHNSSDKLASGSPLKASLFSLSFMLHQWWFSWLITYMIMYVGAMNLWLNRVAEDKATASFFFKLYGSTQVSSLLLAPLAGFWLDYQVNKADNSPDPLTRRLNRYKAGFWPLFFTTSSLAGILVCRFFDTKLAIYLSILFITFLRALLVAVGSSFLRIRLAKTIPFDCLTDWLSWLLDFPENTSPNCSALWALLEL